MLSWIPTKNGKIYCSPACGNKCTWKDHVSAKKRSEMIARKLGDGWVGRTYENLGWYSSAHRGGFVVRQHGTEFTAIFDSRFIGRGKTPKVAVNVAAARVIQEIENLTWLLRASGFKR